METLDDMLAALEDRNDAPEQRDVGLDRQQSVVPEYDDIDNIDDFLLDLEAEQAADGGGADSYSALLATERVQEAPNVDEYDGAAAHAEHAENNWFEVNGDRFYENMQDAAAALTQNGYAAHYNTGKFINYEGGDATDFRIRGTTSTKVGMIHAITLRSLDDYGSGAEINDAVNFVGCKLTDKSSGATSPCFFRNNGDATYDLAFFAENAGTTRMEIILCGNPMFDIDIQVEPAGRSIWVAQPNLPANPGERFFVDIVTEDGSKPDGIAPFEVQTMGDVDDIKLFNNGDGTYKFACTPLSNGYITVQITLHGDPIKSSPCTVQVGEKQRMNIKQKASAIDSKDIGGIPTENYQPANSTLPPPLQATPVRASQYQPQQMQPQQMQPQQMQMQQPQMGGGYDQGPQLGGGYTAEAQDDYNDYGPEDLDGFDDMDEYDPRPSAHVSNQDLNALLDELGG